MKKHWRSLGYQVRQIGPAATDKRLGRQLAVDLTDSASLSYFVGTDGGTITVLSACSTHTSDELKAGLGF
jgi:hypothetical protein